MRPKRLTPPVRRTARRWRTPPAITHGAEAFEGLAVLDEMKGPLGFLLWQAARDVNLWAAVPPEERAGLFVPGAEASLHGADPLRRGGRAARVAADDHHADGRLAGDGAPRGGGAGLPAHRPLGRRRTATCATAIAFAQAAALAVPMDAGAGVRGGADGAAAGRVLARRDLVPARRGAGAAERRLAAATRWPSRGWATCTCSAATSPPRAASTCAALRAARRHSLRGHPGRRRCTTCSCIAAGHQPQGRGGALRPRRLRELRPRAPAPPRAGQRPRVLLDGARALRPGAHRVRGAPAAHGAARGPAGGAGQHRPRGGRRRGSAGSSSRRGTRCGTACRATTAPRTPPQVLLELAHGAAQLGENERAERAAERAVQTARERAARRRRCSPPSRCSTRCAAAAPPAPAPPRRRARARRKRRRCSRRTWCAR